jgi:hypothetical protein
MKSLACALLLAALPGSLQSGEAAPEAKDEQVLYEALVAAIESKGVTTPVAQAFASQVRVFFHQRGLEMKLSPDVLSTDRRPLTHDQAAYLKAGTAAIFAEEKAKQAARLPAAVGGGCNDGCEHGYNYCTDYVDNLFAECEADVGNPRFCLDLWLTLSRTCISTWFTCMNRCMV